MKKVNFKVVLMALSFAFSFLVLGVNRVEAQAAQTTVSAGGSASSFGKGVFALPQGNFVGQQLALDLLLNAMTADKTVLASFGQGQQGSALYVAIVKRVRYYNAIYALIEGGKPTAEAITIALSQLAFTPDATEITTQSQLATLKAGAVDLLN